MKPDFEKETAELRGVLADFSGGWAWIQELSASHTRLTIALSQKSHDRKVYVFLPSCSHITAPINWGNCDLELMVVDLHCSPPQMALVDRTNGVQIKYSGIACWSDQKS